MRFITMKRKFPIIISLILILLLISPSVYSDTKDRSKYFNIFNQAYEYDNMPTLKIEAYFDDIPELSEKIKAEYESLMAPVPNDIKAQLKESGVIVYIVKSTSGYYSKLSDTAPNGFFNPSNLQIFINTSYDEEFDTYDFAAYRIGISLYHELGHAVDQLNGNCSDSPEFQSVFNEEKKGSLFFRNSSSEMFADIFYNYLYGIYSIANGYIPLHGYDTHINIDCCPKCTACMIKLLNLEDIYDENAQVRMLIEFIFSDITIAYNNQLS